ncbi:hypothetical protein Fot_13673 [Forsythia ovata]|uniref:Uncharacterized protein n=1 Tax=Forsythia ovata TaxID=205694 RepID=A0ABD1W446_9LAMI
MEGKVDAVVVIGVGEDRVEGEVEAPIDTEVGTTVDGGQEKAVNTYIDTTIEGEVKAAVDTGVGTTVRGDVEEADQPRRRTTQYVRQKNVQEKSKVFLRRSKMKAVEKPDVNEQPRKTRVKKPSQ